MSSFGEHPEIEAVVERLIGAWREGVLPGVHAVGRRTGAAGRLAPFVAVSPARDPRPRTWAPTRLPADRLARALIARFGPLPPRGFRTVQLDEPAGATSVVVGVATGRETAVTRLAVVVAELRRLQRTRRPLLLPGVLSVPLAWADERTREMLLRFDAPLETEVAYLAPSRTAAARGTLLWDGGTRVATAGVRIAGNERWVATAGHLGAARGDVLRIRRGRRDDGVCGEVVATTHPADVQVAPPAPPGLDLALVRLDTAAKLDGWELTRPIGIHLPDGTFCRLKGARTGRRDCYTAGTLAVTGDPAAPHTDVVIVGGRPRKGVGRCGDSGSAVFTYDGALVGHLVRTGGFTDGRARQLGFVQSVELALDFIAAETGADVQLFGDLGD